MSTDLTFFTNEKNHSLLDRFKATLNNTKYFDILVGYFRSSGFYQLYQSLEEIEKIRVLVGLNVDKNAFDLMTAQEERGLLDFESHKRTKEQFQKNLIQEIENSPEDDERLQLGVQKFVEFLSRECSNNGLDPKHFGNGKKLEIRAYPSKNLHAKVYISRYDESVSNIQYGSVITGSSNFSESGFVAQREFNVELKNRTDVNFALEQFEALWSESVDISEDFIDAATNKTWLNDKIDPYDLYLKCIYEYLEEDINLEEDWEPYLPEGFMELRYQKQAATNAKKILETYNGVFLADVVGLGKTFISALLLQQLQGHVLIVCPPVLKDYWEESLRDFGVRSFKVESLGKLENIVNGDISKYKYILVDEAHRFRNEGTQAYAHLLDICRGKKVILVTATPINNTVDDIFAQLKLFQPPKNSTIPGVPDLQKFFNDLKKRLKAAKPKKTNAIELIDYDLEIEKQEYKNAVKEVSDSIRGKILKFVMVRRTRTDVKKFFKDDVNKQGLVFPDVSDPGRIVYQFEDELETIFHQTIELLHKFKYTRYIPLLYYAGNKELTEFERQQQRNIGGFMKGILVKRLESSFYAFKMSISRFIESYEKFIAMYKQGTVYISKKANVYDLIENDDFSTLEVLVEKDKAQKYISEDFTENFQSNLEYDITILKQIKELWKGVNEDPKIDKFIHELQKRPELKKQKIVIFTESKETGDYLFEKMLKAFPKKVMFYSSKGGRHENLKLVSKNAIARDLIRDNFDPNQKSTYQVDNIKYLITTDVLAEGINLHRSNVLINYDLPWNPTRVLQRAGRVNRLGSKFKNVHIFNFFPTTHSDVHLGLEANITNKLQMFHYIMGEDAKYLTDGEEIGTQELFNTLNSKTAYTGEDGEESSELKYLEMMRTLRDENPDKFDQIKKLPKKARSGKKTQKIENNELVTFFRLGKLKKFYRYQERKSQEINFFDAVELLECKPETPRQRIPQEYFKLLNVNKARFEIDTTQGQEPTKTGGGRSNTAFIERILKDKLFKNFKKFTDTDDEFLEEVKKQLADGLIAKKTAQVVKKEIEQAVSKQGIIDPMKVLFILQKHIKITTSHDVKQSSSYHKREVILSGYLINHNQ
ncbi:helicase-related protein [Cyclobacterium sp. SYSU L10401]|uniref:helicase-related protein n=1 Tax=Cyclobacterium sp. SYSU L10401 TaxID=2678657 RepID=UPI0013D1934B|nr:helicase-related protein [Cyclobacterium sp. SYSU L10401]